MEKGNREHSLEKVKLMIQREKFFRYVAIVASYHDDPHDWPGALIIFRKEIMKKVKGEAVYEMTCDIEVRIKGFHIAEDLEKADTLLKRCLQGVKITGVKQLPGNYYGGGEMMTVKITYTPEKEIKKFPKLALK